MDQSGNLNGHKHAPFFDGSLGRGRLRMRMKEDDNDNKRKREREGRCTRRDARE